MNKVIALFFALSCLLTAIVSSRLLGVGMWFWIIIACGLFVPVSQFIPMLADLGSAAAAMLATISVLAVVLTLLAANIGGSFSLDGGTALLVFGFSLMAVFGFTLKRMNRRPQLPEVEIE
jgi:hypothetical protein